MDKEIIKKSSVLINEGCSIINRLFLVCAMSESDELKEFLDDLEIESWRSILPSISETTLDRYDDNKAELLYDKGIHGLLAECHYNVMDDFDFHENGSFRSCGNTCSFMSFIVYAENLNELMDKVLAKDKELFNLQIEEARIKQGIKVNS
ncbi:MULTISPECIES: hypothetical protein [unclassified Bacteroides]|jgi:hypothetical protein|uniref:hypothetical protein n=1 Tax=unclassified Bacteroides TaxID=2646097 RepID=UPI000E862AD1|nr:MULTISPECIES: hypothetical protein [unclassified Bacteroides]RGN42344.1 hypothetical protein DXB63_16925 [Bacteroides sp. OM05-12]RHR68860.1 hypothetical protein DWW69_19425 [Bacteroides sp. AF16-49]